MRLVSCGNSVYYPQSQAILVPTSIVEQLRVQSNIEDDMEFSLSDAVSFAGAIQAVLVAVFVFQQKKLCRKTAFYLGTFFIALSVFILNAFFYNTNIYLEYPHLLGTTEPVIPLIPPLFYLFIKSLSNPQSQFKKREILHFIPFIIVLLISFPTYLASEADKIIFMTSEKEYNIYHYAFVLLPILGYPIYFLLSNSIIGKELKKTTSWVSSEVVKELQIVTLLLLILFTITFITNLFNFLFVVTIISPLFLTILVYHVLHIYMKYHMGIPEKSANSSTHYSTNHHSKDKQKYQNSTLTESAKSIIVANIERGFIAEKQFLREGLTLADLASTLQITPHHLSQILNDHYEKNFFTFVNELRVTEAIQSLENRDKNHLTISAIALECGFNSISSFNTSFKRFAKCTPSSYRNQQTSR